MGNITKKIASVVLSTTTVIWLVGVAPIAMGATATELQAQINLLLQQIQALQSQLGTGTTVTTTATTIPTLTRDLTVGAKGTDVSALQSYLISGGYLKVAAPTGYFGSLTQAAVAAWQKANNVTPSVGYFGARSRAALSLLAVGTVTTGGTPAIVPVGAGLLVSLATDNPSARTIGSGTAFNPALKVALTAGPTAVSVTSLKITKGGFVSNTNLNGIDVVDSKGVRHGNVISSVNADNSILITMTNDPVMVAAGTTEYLTIRFNLANGSYTGTVALSILSSASITANTTAISGNFPITGSAMNIVSGTSALASTTLAVLTSTGSSTLSVSPTDLQEITRFRIQEASSNEGVYLYSMNLYNYGNAGAGDYKDVTLFAQDGSTVLAVAQPMDKNVNFVLAAPYFIDKGLQKDFIVKAKLINGTTKTINLVVYNDYDLDLRGATTLVSVIPAPSTSGDTSFPIGNGFNIQTIGSGTITLTRASDSPSSAVVPGSSDVVLAKFNAKPNGENFELRQISFYIATSSGGIVLTGSVTVKVNDQVVLSTAASNVPVAAATTFTLSSYPILTAGVNNTITITGSISSLASSASTYTVTDFDLINAKRLITNDLLDNAGLAVGVVAGLQISVQSAALVVTTLSTPVAGSVVAGTVGYPFADFQLNAGSGGEDVRVSKVIVDHVEATNLTEVANLLLYKDNDTSPLSTSASTATNASTVTFNFSTPIVVPRSTPVTLHLKADAVSGSNTHTFRITSSSDAVTAVGVTTGNTLTSGTQITFAGNGQGQTLVANGTLTLSLVSGSSASPSTAQVMSVGTNNATVFAFRMISQYESQKLTSLKLTASSSDLLLSTTTLKNIKLYEGTNSTPFATAAQFDSCIGGLCTVTFVASDNMLSAPVSLSGVTVTVKADVASGGDAFLTDSFIFKIASSTGDVAVKGSVTGLTTATKTGTPTVTGITYIVPGRVLVEAVSPTTPQQVGSSGNGAAAGQQLAVFKITNNTGVSIRLSTSTTGMKFAQTGTTTSTFDIYVGDSVGGATVKLNSPAVATVTGYATFDISTSTAANRTINGGASRYFVIKNADVMVTGATAQFSVGAIGDLKFQVDETDLGYDGNSNGTLTDTIQGLFMDGIPSVSPVSAL